MQMLERQAQNRRAIEHDAGVDAKAVFEGVIAQTPKTPAEKSLFMHALAMREYMESGWVDRLWWFDTLDMLADGMTKGSIDREALVRVCQHGLWSITGQTPVFKRLRDTSAPTTDHA